MLSPIAIQNALRIVVSLKEDGVEANLERILAESKLVDERQAAADKDLSKANKLVTASKADSKRLNDQIDSVSKMKADVEAIKVKSDKRDKDLNGAMAKFNRDKEASEAEIATKQAELDKLITSAKRAKTTAEKNEAKSAQILADLEQRKARIEEAWS